MAVGISDFITSQAEVIKQIIEACKGHEIRITFDKPVTPDRGTQNPIIESIRIIGEQRDELRKKLEELGGKCTKLQNENDHLKRVRKLELKQQNPDVTWEYLGGLIAAKEKEDGIDRLDIRESQSDQGDHGKGNVGGAGLPSQEGSVDSPVDAAP